MSRLPEWRRLVLYLGGKGVNLLLWEVGHISWFDEIILERNPLCLDIDIIALHMLKWPSVMGSSCARTKGQGWPSAACWDALSIPMPAAQTEGVNGSRGIRRSAKIRQGWQVLLGQLQYCCNTSSWAWLLSKKWRVKVIFKDTEVGHLHHWLWPKYLPWEWSLIPYPSQTARRQGWKPFHFFCVCTCG